MTTKTAKLSEKDMKRLRAYVQSIAIWACEAQQRLDGDKQQSYLIDILSDIRGDLEQAEKLSMQDDTL